MAAKKPSYRTRNIRSELDRYDQKVLTNSEKARENRRHLRGLRFNYRFGQGVTAFGLVTLPINAFVFENVITVITSGVTAVLGVLTFAVFAKKGIRNRTKLIEGHEEQMEEAAIKAVSLRRQLALQEWQDEFEELREAKKPPEPTWKIVGSRAVSISYAEAHKASEQTPDQRQMTVNAIKRYIENRRRQGAMFVEIVAEMDEEFGMKPGHFQVTPGAMSGRLRLEWVASNGASYLVDSETSKEMNERLMEKSFVEARRKRLREADEFGWKYGDDEEVVDLTDWQGDADPRREWACVHCAALKGRGDGVRHKHEDGVELIRGDGTVTVVSVPAAEPKVEAVVQRIERVEKLSQKPMSIAEELKRADEAARASNVEAALERRKWFKAQCGLCVTDPHEANHQHTI